MSYFCLVPEGAHEGEHMTLFWCDGMEIPIDTIVEVVEEFNELCPLNGYIMRSVVNLENNKETYPVEVPEALAALRENYKELSQSEFPEWWPHITKTRDREPGTVRFTHCEFRA